MSLTITSLACRRGTKTVLAGLDLSLSEGQAVVLRGPNGVGKSTLLRCLAGLMPAEGKITLDGVSVTDLDAYTDLIAYAGHLDAIKPQMSVVENLTFWAAIYGGDPALALTGLGIDHIADRPAGMCSAGQKRRLGLARLVLTRRKLWLLDEPTVSLDSEGTLALTNIVRSHLKTGGMAVIATHIDLDLDAEVLSMTPPEPTAIDPFLEGSY